MANYNDGLAFDLDIFDDAKNGYVPELKSEKKLKLPRLLEPKRETEAQIEARARAGRFAALKAVAFAFLALMILGSVIYGQVALTNLESELSRQKSELKIAKSEYVRLSTEVNSMLSMSNVEEYARDKLGMVKQENCQIYYYDITEGGGAELTASGSLNR